ncbi:MAG: hypothetical protein HFI76_11170 [Lachnospiraceae bacterium]|jgi:hypothetical protein|nr:hypothetical protein [Lachnospiraceae bacterium]
MEQICERVWAGSLGEKGAPDIIDKIKKTPSTRLFVMVSFILGCPLDDTFLSENIFGWLLIVPPFYFIE